MNYVAGNNLFGRIRRLFGATSCGLQVAALPWRKKNGAVEIMLITSRDTGRWVLPKGWPAEHEELCDAAAREAEEEAGVSGAVSPVDVGRYFYVKGVQAGDDVRCEVLVYSLEVDKVAGKWKEKGQRKRKWVAPDEAARMVNEPDLAQLISAFRANSRRTSA